MHGCPRKSGAWPRAEIGKVFILRFTFRVKAANLAAIRLIKNNLPERARL
jgi:hypothetical protein